MWHQVAHILYVPTLVKPKKIAKSGRLVARVSNADKAVITKAATLAGQSVGSFVVAQARKAAAEAEAKAKKAAAAAARAAKGGK